MLPQPQPQPRRRTDMTFDRRAAHPKRARGPVVLQPYVPPPCEQVPLHALAIPVNGADPDAEHRAQMRQSAAFLRLLEERKEPWYEQNHAPPEPGSWDACTQAQKAFAANGLFATPDAGREDSE